MRDRLHINILFALLYAIVLTMPGCSGNKEPEFECLDNLGCVDIAAGEPIQIGVLQALSGSIAPLGEAQIHGLKLALAKRGGTIHNHKVELQIENTGCSAEGGANAALKVIADPQTVAIFGTTCSGAAATAAKAMSTAGMTMISGNNSAPFLTSIAGKAAPNWQPGYFRTANNEEYAGHVAAEYAFKELKLRKAATIHDNDIYTQGLTNSFITAFKDLGGQIVLDTAVNKGDTNMLPVLEAVAKSQAQLLFFPLFPAEGKQLLTQTRLTPEFNKIVLMSDGALIQQSFLDVVGDTAKGMLFVGPSKPKGEAVDALYIAYENLFKEQPKVTYFITGYDAASILLDAIEKVAVLDSSGVLHIGRNALRETMYKTRSYPGVSGILTCNQFGDCAQPSFNVLRLDQPVKGLEGLEENIIY